MKETFFFLAARFEWPLSQWFDRSTSFVVSGGFGSWWGYWLFLPATQALGTIGAERKGMNSGREEEGEERTVCGVLSPSLHLSVPHKLNARNRPCSWNAMERKKKELTYMFLKSVIMILSTQTPVGIRSTVMFMVDQGRFSFFQNGWNPKRSFTCLPFSIGSQAVFRWAYA